MTLRSPTSRRFEPGTTGWSEEDLDDSRIERLWQRRKYEIVEGEPTKKPTAYLEGSLPLRRLVRQIERHLEQTHTPGEFGFEADVVINRVRLPRVDAVFLTPQQIERQRAIQATLRGWDRLRYGRLRVPPELVIESLSPGHENHDRETKRRWYADFGIPHYWLLDPYRRTLECLARAGTAYQRDVAGREADELKTVAFPASRSDWRKSGSSGASPSIVLVPHVRATVAFSILPS